MTFVELREQYLVNHAIGPGRHGPPIVGDCSLEDFSGAQFTNGFFKGCIFNGSCFENANFEGSVFEACHFIQVEGNKPCFANAIFIGCNFTGSKLEGANFQKCIFEGLNLFTHASLYGALFDEARFVGVANSTRFLYAGMKSVSMIKADLQGAYFNSAHLTCADLTAVKAKGVSFLDCQMAWVILKEGNFVEADFSGATMTGVRWWQACFKGAIMLEHQLASWAVVPTLSLEDNLRELEKVRSVANLDCNTSQSKTFWAHAQVVYGDKKATEPVATPTVPTPAPTDLPAWQKVGDMGLPYLVGRAVECLLDTKGTDKEQVKWAIEYLQAYYNK
jgi:uncharacterized protein YjbI with pentapeptide repeats